MKQSRYYLMNIIVKSVLLSFSFNVMFILIGLRYFYDNFIKSISFEIAIYLLPILFVLFAILTFILFKTNVGKAYVEEYNIRRKNKIKSKFKKSQQLDKEMIPSYNQSNTFTLKKKSSTKALYTMFIGILVVLLSLVVDGIALMLLVICSFVLFIVSMYYMNKYITIKLTIDANGLLVESKKKSTYFKWSDVKTIGISGYNEINNYIYFSKANIKNGKIFVNSRVNKNIMVLKYGPEIVHCILQYWDDEILNLDMQKSWLKYLEYIIDNK